MGTTDDNIRIAAMKEFATHGFEGARVERIARRAKANKAMIYYHFKNKEKLYEAVLTEMYTRLHEHISESGAENLRPDDRLDAMVSAFIDFVYEVDQDFVRVMLRELSMGGKYFKKLMLPNVIIPLMEKVERIFSDGAREGIFRSVVPYYTFLQTIGSIVFSNLIRLTLSDTDFGKAFFHDDFKRDFRENLLGVLRMGILAR
jgi:TetR/AcrR family transcriptional regulator